MPHSPKLVLHAPLLALIVLFLGGCQSSDNNSESDSGQTESAPQLTMTLPDSMTTTSTTAAARIALATDPGTCDFNGDEHSDWFDNGYKMSQFLVALSQSQSCIADAVIGTMVQLKSLFENKGKQPVPGAESDPEAPKWVNYQTSGETSQLWLYWDDTDTQIMYMTWTGSEAAGYEGKMIYSGWPEDTNDPGAPRSVRVDFSRGADSAVNQIYMAFAADHPGKLTGFHVMVTRTGSGTDASYEAKGYLETEGQFMSTNLPATETFLDPSFSIVTVVDSTGDGATISGFNNLALHLADSSTPGSEFSLGSYQFSLEDKVYFDATGTIGWKHKGPTEGHYVNTSGANTRSGTVVNAVMSCLEVTSPSCTDIPDMNLGTGYFTTTCTDTDGADCKAFIQGFYDLGFMGSVPNSTDAEPADWRATAITGVTPLTLLWPSAQDDATTTFVIPAAQ